MRASALLPFLLFFLLPTGLRAQELAISIKVTTDSLRPIGKAGIRLSTGSEIPIKASTSVAGNASINVRVGVTYIIDISAPGYAVYTGNLYADSSRRTFSYKLQKSQSLEGATVTASRTIMKQDGDMTVVDPEQLSLASTSGYEVLEKTPGIIADQDGNFYLSSATPANIYINGREMKMSAADIAAMLKSLPPNTIQRIEILRTPSAKYDASGGGGIINIVLKKGVKLGLTGSANAGIQQGVYGNQHAGANMSYGDGDMSTYVNLNVSQRKSLEQINSMRVLAPDTLLSQDAGTVYSGQNVFFNYGADKGYKEKWDLSYGGRAGGNLSDNRTDNINIIRQKSTGAAASDNRTGIDYAGSNWNLNQNVEAKYKIDTSGSEWTTALTWNGTFVKNGQEILSRFALPALNDIDNKGEVKTQRHYIALQSDLKYKFPKKLTFEGGIKSTIVTFRHTSDYNIRYDDSVYEDPLRSTTYNYRENINAGYAQVTKELGDVIIKGGVRAENTNMDGTQTRPGDTSFSVHVGSSRVDLQACKLEYSIVSPK